MEHSTSTLIDFQKDFEDHMRELASEISGLHMKTALDFKDDYTAIQKLYAGMEEADNYYYQPI
ncbi:MAG: hypothetical protein WC865_12735 [Bacteroidales bacterium]